MNITPKKFFDRLSEKNGYADPQTMEDYYYGMVKVIVDELKNGGSVRLPDFGEFKITTMKARKIMNVNTGVHDNLPACKVLKFIPCIKIRDYIKKNL